MGLMQLRYKIKNEGICHKYYDLDRLESQNTCFSVQLRKSCTFNIIVNLSVKITTGGMKHN